VRAGGTVEYCAHPELGPNGNALYTDVAWLGQRDAPRVLVAISGTHGVEGFCGSGAQVALLRKYGANDLPAGVALLMIHAVNPYGFAWLRRVTHENVDLNRNWVDFKEPLPTNPGYMELHAALCPETWTADSLSAGSNAIAKFLAQHGETALAKATSGGQFSHADGIFYGGSEPTWSRKLLTSIFSNYLNLAEKVAIIDFHTGLGPWGYGEQIVTVPTDSSAFQRARAWFGCAVTSTQAGSSSSTAIVGDGLSAAASLLPRAEVTSVALEFGTLAADQVLLALCADCWLHNHGALESNMGRSIKQQIRAAFYADTDAWKGMVIGQSRLAFRQAISALSGN